MFTYVFGAQVDMNSLDVSKYTGGFVTGFSTTEVDIADAAGDTAVITGQNFNPIGPSGTVTGAALKDAASHSILTGSHLNLDLSKIYADRGSRTALFSDLFDSGVSLTGSVHDDVLVGGAAGDILIGGLGNDTLDGGKGVNTASYATATTAVTVSIVATKQNTGGAGMDTLVRIQNLTGSAFNDTLKGDIHPMC